MRENGFQLAHHIETQNGGLRSILGTISEKGPINQKRTAAIIFSKSAIFKIIILCDLKMKELIKYEFSFCNTTTPQLHATWQPALLLILRIRLIAFPLNGYI